MANNTEELKLIISGDGRLLSAEIKKEEQQIKGFANRTKSMFVGMRKQLNAGGNKILGNPFAGMFSAAAIGYAGSRVIEFDDKLATLRNQFKLSAEDTFKLREALIKTADDSRKSWDDVIDSATELADKTGDLNLVKEGLTGIGVAATATSSDMLDIAKVSTGLTQNMGILPGQLKDAFGILAAQGDTGSFIFSEMATNAERLTAAAAQLNLKGLKDLKEYGAFLQMVRPSFGSADEAATMVKNIMVRIKTEAKKIKKEAGFDVYDGNGKLKSFASIIEGIVKGTRGDVVKLNNIFGESAIAFTKFNDELALGRGFQMFESYLTDAGSDALWQKFLVKAGTAKSSIQLLSNAGMKASDKLLSKPIAEMANALNSMLKNPEKLKDFETTMGNIGEIVAVMAKGVIMAASGWGKIIGLIDQAAQEYGDTKTLETQWNVLPKGEKKELHKRFKLGSVSGRQNYYEAMRAAITDYNQRTTQNIINMQLQITESGRLVTESSDSNTRINAAVNRGSFPGVKKK